jgi:hypothetical protein
LGIPISVSPVGIHIDSANIDINSASLITDLSHQLETEVAKLVLSGADLPTVPGFAPLRNRFIFPMFPNYPG